MSDKEQIMIDGINLSDIRSRLEDGQRASISTKEFEEIIDLLEEKTQECEELKRKVELMMDCPDCKVDEYKKALEEIEEYINNQGIDNKWNMRIQKFRLGILDIINKAKGE